MNAVMYIVLRSPESLPMSTGKAAAQAAHAAVEAYRLTDPDSNLHRDWYVANHYTKIVLQADDLIIAQEYLEARGIKTTLIIDEGRTEFDGKLTATALGCALVNKDNRHIQETFSTFKLYKDPIRPPVILEVDGRVPASIMNAVRWNLQRNEIEEAKRLLRGVSLPPRKKRWWSR